MAVPERAMTCLVMALSGNMLPGRQHHRQRTGPEFFRKGIGTGRNVVTKLLHLLHTGYMQNHRVILGSAFGFVDLIHSRRIQTVCA